MRSPSSARRFSSWALPCLALAACGDARAPRAPDSRDAATHADDRASQDATPGGGRDGSSRSADGGESSFDDAGAPSLSDAASLDGSAQAGGGSIVADAGSEDASSSPGDAALAPFPCSPGNVNPAQLTPDVLLVLDRSGSMSQSGRWNAAVGGIEAAAAALDARLRFSLVTFPGTPGPQPDCSLIVDIIEQSRCFLNAAGSGSTCAPGSVVVPMTAAAAGPITAALASATPGGGTPTASTLDAARAQLVANGTGPAHRTIIVLITDGAPNCVSGTADTSATEQATAEAVTSLKALLAAGIPSYVLGFDGAEPALTDVLDKLAAAGGGTPKHLPVSTADDLSAAVRTVLERASCTPGP